MYKNYLQFLVSHKGKDVAVYNVKEEGSLTDFVLVQSVASTLENKKFAAEFMEAFNLDFPEGYNRGEWIVFDLGEVIVHSFTADKRAKYNIDKLWQNKRVDEGDKKGRKGAEPSPADKTDKAEADNADKKIDKTDKTDKKSGKADKTDKKSADKAENKSDKRADKKAEKAQKAEIKKSLKKNKKQG